MLSKLELQSNLKPVIINKILRRIIQILIFFLQCTFVFLVICAIVLLLATRSPLHLIYNRIDPAGPGSVYVQGGGFAGFWFQLGLLQAMPSLDKFDFYCYSSGCLNINLEEAFRSAYHAQTLWRAGEISLYQIVEYFLDEVLREVAEVEPMFLKQMNILITTSEEGSIALQASTVYDLKNLLLKTVYIPYITGPTIFPPNGTMYADGGFSIMLHPECEYTITVPTNLQTLIHLFNPSFGLKQAEHFWNLGQGSDHPLLVLNNTF